MKRHFALLAILLVVLFSFPVSSSAQPTDQVRFLQTVEAGKHVTHHLPRPSDLGDFASLEDWIKANYSTYLVPDSLKHNIQDGRDTISFFTVRDDGIFDHHTLFDTGEEFTLQTTSDLKVPGEDEANTIGFTPKIQTSKALPMAANVASSSCSNYACLCAAYARCMVPSPRWPAGSLSYYTEKLKAINWPYPGSPLIGAVAVMQITMPFGHMGVINNMWWNWHGYTADLIVQLNEANYVSCTITTYRSGKIGDLHIVGYFRP